MRALTCFIFFLFFEIGFLHSSPRRKSFIVANVTNENVLINYEFNAPREDQHLAISGFDVFIDHQLAADNALLGSRNYITVVIYSPVFNLAEHPINYFYERLAEIAFNEKLQTLFKSFSIQTMEGEFAIANIGELYNANIRKFGDTYVLGIFGNGNQCTNEEQEQAIRAILRSGG